MDKTQITDENDRERKRLGELTNKLTDRDLSVRLPNGWTVATALVHLAFWDLRQQTMFRRWLDEGVAPGSIDAEAVNGPLQVMAEAIPGRAAVKLSLEAAEAVDGTVAKLNDDQVSELLKMGLERNLRRSVHRKIHLDQIEKTLKD